MQQVLDRSPLDRLREFKYRFAQSMVFGLPVLVLQWAGPALGGNESGRWVGLLQALLAGWVMYVGAAGMLFEGVLLASRGNWATDLFAALLAVGLYIVSIIAWGSLLIGRGPWPTAPMFHVSVFVVIVWCALRWARLHANVRRSANGS